MFKKIIFNTLKAGLVIGILAYLVTSVAHYEITPETLDQISKTVSPSTQEQLQPLLNQSYPSLAEFSQALHRVLPLEEEKHVKKTIIQAAGQPRLNFKRLRLFWDHPFKLLLALFLVIGCSVPLSSFRWWLLLKGVGIEISWSRAFLLTWIGGFFNTTLPGAVSGDLVKGYYIVRAQGAEKKTRAFTTLLIDRFVGLFGLIVMAFISLGFNLDRIESQPSLQPLAWTILGLFAGTVVFYTVVLYPFQEGRDPFIRVLHWFPRRKLFLKIYDAFKTFQHQKPILLITLSVSIIIHSMIALIFFGIADLLSIPNLTLANQLFIMPVGLIAIAVPIAPGGIGVGHIAFESLYGLLGLKGGADVFNLYVILQMSIFLLGSIPYFLYKGDYQTGPENPETQPDFFQRKS